MRNRVIGNRCVWLLTSADAQLAGTLAGPPVSKEGRLSQPLPSRGLVPTAPRLSSASQLLTPISVLTNDPVW